MSKIYNLIIALLLVSSIVVAQDFTVKGKVTDSRTGEALIGANVYLKGTTFGDASSQGGMYEFTAPKGKYTLVCSYIGYETVEDEINLSNNMEANFALEDYEFSLSVEVIADRAKERETPVAFTNVDKKEMQFKLGSRDIPMVLNTTPSVYATPGGGGAGDARVNVRGFSQRNVAIMINGVPINDMENGWVYWSNWDGLGDATSSIQVQRGLSAVNLATPSIGGTMNVVSDPTQQRSSMYFKTEVGSGNFSKQSVFAHTGLVDDKFALSMGVVKKTGDGIVQGTFTDAWSYYLGAAYQINQSNRIELYAMGAPQRHGQRTYKLNAATFSHELARDLGFSEKTLLDSRLQEQGINYNANWSGAPSQYDGNQYYEMYWNTPNTPRYESGHMWERENYYHKPLVNLNWYSQFSDKFSLYTTAYWSGGKGGGSGTYGSMGWNYNNYQRVVDWQSTFDRNIKNTAKIDFDGDGDSTTYKISRGILRNSVNQQWTIGAISKAYYKVNQDLTLSFGVDWRHAEIDHYREVRDLVGGDYFKEYAGNNEFESGLQLYKRNGDKIDYNNTNTVDWLGGYVQAEVTADQVTFYGTAGYSIIKYDFVDHFKKDAAGAELKLQPDWMSGFQLKGGASFRISANADVYANAGYVSKVPIFDGVINDVTSELIPNPKNEKFLSFELGSNLSLLNRTLTLKGNVYYTKWDDRTVTNNSYTLNGQEGIVVVTGMNSTHMGVELSAGFQPIREFRLDAAFSKGIWEQKNDPQATQKIYEANIDTTFTIYIDGVKVGDAPQTQLALAGTLFPFEGFQVQLVWKYYADYYADWAAETRTNINDRAQSWQIPSFNLFDLHMSYNLPIDVAGADVSVFAHVFNLFNNLYVADATDNSQYNAYGEYSSSVGHVVPYNPHSAEAAEVYPGLPINFNAGFSVRF